MSQPNIFFRLMHYFGGLLHKLLELKDTPHAIAGGAAIGMFMGFTPLFGLKTLLSLGSAYLLRCNPMAAVVTVCLHDIVTPFWPVLLRIEYDIGSLVLNHSLPQKFEMHPADLAAMLKWTTFLDVGLPLLVGSLFLATPAAVLTYMILLWIMKRRIARKEARADQTPEI